MNVTPHLNLRGTAREALDFYRSVFGGEVTLVTYADAQAVTDPAEADQIMWGQVESAAGFRIMAFDVAAARDWNPGVIPFFVSARCTDADELTGYWTALVEGGTVLFPLGQAQWSPLYGMVTDRFGITWVMDLEVHWG